ncbi:hypothetical protein F3Y22_tig00110450pilonHSYRG00162 [Hibiscus syriacus]|uniref:Uncharacterized protein n=1 Tax=Hibiscus syriacus TaxID=106335 RepID=A0A6A3AKR5_HIBSY|nr:hypothetical protein F3Y22_tig00110450pilonHSYRG00162 [Hibiscus syriacus]
MFNEPLLISPSTPRPLNLHNKIVTMDHTDADTVKLIEECHEVHNVDESDTLVEGYHNVGFTHKDLYNALQRGKAKEIVDGDVNALIAYFDYKKHDNPRFFMTYSVDESGALYNLIWSDSTSRSDYTCFGRPIMPIDSVNHHHNTIVFATAIIVDETSQSFKGLSNLLSLMLSTYYALGIFLTMHKLTAAFSKCMASWWTTEEFDIQWRSVVLEFNVEKHPWVIEKGNTRHLRAQAYLTSHFFANIRSTQSYVDLNVSPEVIQMARFAALCSSSSRLFYIASKTDESFKTARYEMKRLIEELENSFGLNDSVNQSIVVNNVLDPQRKQRKQKEVPKNKVKKKIRRCGYYNGEGHNKLTCP